MSNPIPSSLALTTISGTISASPHNSNYGAGQTATNALITALSGGAAGQKLEAADSTHVQWVYPPGYEFGYDQITSNVNVIGGTSAAATTVIAGSSHTFDGGAVICEFFSTEVTSPSAAAGNITLVGLYESGSLITTLAAIATSTSGQTGASVCARLRFTPTAASHTYSVSAWATNTTGTPAVAAGSGAAGAAAAPAYLRFTKV